MARDRQVCMATAMWILAMVIMSSLGLCITLYIDRSKNKKHLAWAEDACRPSNFQLSTDYIRLRDLPLAWIQIIDRPTYAHIKPVMLYEDSASRSVVFKYNYPGTKLSADATILVVESDFIPTSDLVLKKRVKIKKNANNPISVKYSINDDSAMTIDAQILSFLIPFVDIDFIYKIRVSGKIIAVTAKPAASCIDYADLIFAAESILLAKEGDRESFYRRRVAVVERSDPTEQATGQQ